MNVTVKDTNDLDLDLLYGDDKWSFGEYVYSYLPVGSWALLVALVLE